MKREQNKCFGKSLKALFGKKNRFSYLLLVFIYPAILQASHILGGELSFDCIDSNDQIYWAKLTLYRDCNRTLGFDNSAAIGYYFENGALWNFNGGLVEDINEIPPILFDTCKAVPPEACIEVGTYRTFYSFPSDSSGFLFTYQRCCRGASISNLQNPGQEGITLYAYMTREGMNLCNDSPYFDRPPPNFFCINEPILLDHSAKDTQGDSLVYELCTPLNMLDTSDPIPTPPAGPPFPEANWQAPYSLNNLLGGDEPLRIDSQTGLITGTPKTAGQFVVRVCVYEYRNGVLLSETSREFIYFVGQCLPTITADFEAEIACNGLEAAFINASEGTNDFLWDFGMGDNQSNALAPSFLYGSDGAYDVTLIAAPNDICADTMRQTIAAERACGLDENLQFPVTAENAVLCVGEKTQLAVPYCEEYDYQWFPIPEVDGVNGHNPVVSPLESTIYQVEISDENDCTWTNSILIEVLTYCDEPILTYPNAFSPNGDGRNDIFSLFSNYNFTDFSLKIFSRWGELVFQSNDIEAGWNGFQQGEPVPTDVYVWMATFSYEGKNGLEKGRDVGEVVVLR